MAALSGGLVSEDEQDMGGMFEETTIDEEEEKLKARALRAVVKDDVAVVTEVLNLAPVEKWSKWQNKNGKDLLTMSLEFGSSRTYHILARELGKSKEAKREEFDQTLIEEAEEAAAEFYPISLGAVKRIWEKACDSTDGHGISEKGWRTLEHIAKEHPLDRMAELFLTQALKNGKELRRPEQRVEETQEVKALAPAVPVQPKQPRGGFRPGQRVRLLGLRKTVDLNNRLAVLDHFETNSGRWVMHLDDDADGNYWRILPLNIEPISEPVRAVSRTKAAPKTRSRGGQSAGQKITLPPGALKVIDKIGKKGTMAEAVTAYEKKCKEAIDEIKSQIAGATNVSTIEYLQKQMARLLQGENLRKGQSVIVNGVNGRPELNGAIGLLWEFDMKTGHWLVQVDGGGCCRVLPTSLRPAKSSDIKSNIMKKPAAAAFLLKSGSMDGRERPQQPDQADKRKRQSAEFTAEELEDIGFDDPGHEVGSRSDNTAGAAELSRRGRERPVFKRPAAAEEYTDAVVRPRKVRKTQREEDEEEGQGKDEDYEGEEEEEEEGEEEEEHEGEEEQETHGRDGVPRKIHKRSEETPEKRLDERYPTNYETRHLATGLVDRPSARPGANTTNLQAQRENSRPTGRPLERLAIRPMERLVMRQTNDKAMEERRNAARMAGSTALERAAHIKQEKDDEAVTAVRKLFEMPWETSNRIAQEQQRLRQQQQELHRQVILHQQKSLALAQAEAKKMCPPLGRLATNDRKPCISTVRSPAKRKAPLPLDLRTQQKLLFMKRPAAECQIVALRRPAGSH